LKQPTHLKIILKKTGNVKKFKGTKIGMTICRYLQPSVKYDAKGKVIVNENTLTGTKKSNKNLAIRGITRLITQTKAHLEPPEMENIERKLQILHGEKFKESSYYSEEVSSLYFNWNPTEGPFIIIPSLDHEEKTSNYRLTSKKI
jgi:calpain